MEGIRVKTTLVGEDYWLKASPDFVWHVPELPAMGVVEPPTIHGHSWNYCNWLPFVLDDPRIPGMRFEYEYRRSG